MLTCKKTKLDEIMARLVAALAFCLFVLMLTTLANDETLTAIFEYLGWAI